MTGLTDAEREALIEAIQNGDQDRLVNAILAARLAPIEALAAEWEADYSRRLNFAAADLRAALADPQPEDRR